MEWILENPIFHMLFFSKLVDETQISKPPETTRHHNTFKLWILLPLSADLLSILQYETPCITVSGKGSQPRYMHY